MNIVVIEDEAVVAQRIERLLRMLLVDRSLNIRACGTIETARDTLSDVTPDLVLLDLNLNGADGFDLLEPFLTAPYPVVVVSAYKDRAIEAFEHGVLDFVPKPITTERLSRALERLNGVRAPDTQFARRIAVAQSGRTDYIEVDQITSAHGAGDYSELATTTGKAILCDKPLHTLELLLGPEFIRIHRSHLLRVADVTSLHAMEGSRYVVELVDGRTFPVGRNRVAALRDRLESGGL